jgi:hypothetical protein
MKDTGSWSWPRTQKAYRALGGLGYHDEEHTRDKCSRADIVTVTWTVGHYMKAYADALRGRPLDKENKPTSTITPLDLFAENAGSDM